MELSKMTMSIYVHWKIALLCKRGLHFQLYSIDSEPVVTHLHKIKFH